MITHIGSKQIVTNTIDTLCDKEIHQNFDESWQEKWIDSNELMPQKLQSNCKGCLLVELVALSWAVHELSIKISTF